MMNRLNTDEIHTSYFSMIFKILPITPLKPRAGTEFKVFSNNSSANLTEFSQGIPFLAERDEFLAGLVKSCLKNGLLASGVDWLRSMMLIEFQQKIEGAKVK
jgi:hypothetical protein